jgi:hypothetical protein
MTPFVKVEASSDITLPSGDTSPTDRHSMLAAKEV